MGDHDQQQHHHPLDDDDDNRSDHGEESDHYLPSNKRHVDEEDQRGQRRLHQYHYHSGSSSSSSAGLGSAEAAASAPARERYSYESYDDPTYTLIGEDGRARENHPRRYHNAPRQQQQDREERQQGSRRQGSQRRPHSSDYLYGGSQQRYQQPRPPLHALVGSFRRRISSTFRDLRSGDVDGTALFLTLVAVAAVQLVVTLGRRRRRRRRARALAREDHHHHRQRGENVYRLPPIDEDVEDEVEDVDAGYLGWMLPSTLSDSLDAFLTDVLAMCWTVRFHLTAMWCRIVSALGFISRLRIFAVVSEDEAGMGGRGRRRRRLGLLGRRGDRGRRREASGAAAATTVPQARLPGLEDVSAQPSDDPPGTSRRVVSPTSSSGGAHSRSGGGGRRRGRGRRRTTAPLEHAFASDGSYPPGWLVYDPTTGDLVPRKATVLQNEVVKIEPGAPTENDSYGVREEPQLGQQQEQQRQQQRQILERKHAAEEASSAALLEEKKEEDSLPSPPIVGSRCDVVAAAGVGGTAAVGLRRRGRADNTTAAGSSIPVG